MKLFQLVLVMISILPMPSSAEENGLSDLQEIEIRNHLKRFNKPAERSIESPDGDIIDCVSIFNQPAFDHPLLRNHTIKMMSDSYLGENLENTDNQPEIIPQLWHMNGECPVNTVPIKRTTREDLLRVDSIEQFGKKSEISIQRFKYDNLSKVVVQHNGHEYAIMSSKDERYYGSRAMINVWQPHVQAAREFSVSQIWVLGGNFGSDLNSLEAGWAVDPHIFGDRKTRFFIYWTNDAYKSTGCFNLLCPGFVHTSRKVALGASFQPLSTYNGEQFEIKVAIWKGRKTGDWWLKLNGIHVGYWPDKLFPNLAEGATLLEWGGEITNIHKNGQHTSTQMGSGHFAEEGLKKASYFRSIRKINEFNSLAHPKQLDPYISFPNCYNVKSGFDEESGNFFFYGGPGRSPVCP